MPLYSQDQINAITARIKHVRYAMLTTADDRQALSSRPLTSQQLDNEGNLWFFTSDEAEFTHELERHPDVNVSFSNPNEGIYLSLSGRAYLLKDRAKARELWKPQLVTWFRGGLDDPHLALLRVRIQSAEYWDGGAGRMQQLFALAKAAVRGEGAMGMGRPKTICL